MSTYLPNILILGPTGTGKSSCIEQAPPDKVTIINIENKDLPFPTGKLFKQVTPKSAHDIFKIMGDAHHDTERPIIFIDSLTKAFELFAHDCEQKYKGYDIWRVYGQMVWKMLEECKSTTHIVVAICHPLIDKFVQPNGAESREVVAAVQGSWKGKVEKEFLCLLYSHAERKRGVAQSTYLLQTQHDGIYPAKTPRGILNDDEFKIPNDIFAFITRYKETYGLNINI